MSKTYKIVEWVKLLLSEPCRYVIKNYSIFVGKITRFSGRKKVLVLRV